MNEKQERFSHGLILTLAAAIGAQMPATPAVLEINSAQLG